MDIREYLANNRLITDGAMGTWYDRLTGYKGNLAERANLENQMCIRDRLLDEAIVFATHAHAGQVRKMANTPYILHPLEVASIIATMTGDENTMAAGVLHDTVEDCDVDPKEIKRRFGERVSACLLYTSRCV